MNEHKFVKHIHAFVLGAGFAGLQTGAQYAQSGEVVVIDKATADGKANHREGNASQGKMRGAREVSQPASLAWAIGESMGIFKEMQTDDTSILYYPDEPYLMVVKDKSALDALCNDLSMNSGYKRGEDFTVYTPEAFAHCEERHGIQLPQGYAGVIDIAKTRGSRLNMDNLMDICENRVKESGGGVHLGTQVTDYAKRIDGTYVVETTSADGQKAYYHADKMAVAPGAEMGSTLTQLHDFHQRHVGEDGISPVPIDVPERFSGENSFAVPQRTLYVELPEDAMASFIREDGLPGFGGLYALDIDNTIETADGQRVTHKNHLGFYAFTEKNDEGKWNVKIGYDPMPFISSKGEHPEVKDMIFQKQEDMMLDYLSRVFNTNITSDNVVRRDECEYPLSQVPHPCVGQSPQAHDLLIVGGAQGYGAMALMAALKDSIHNGGKKLAQAVNADWHPDQAVKDIHRNVCDTLYKPLDKMVNQCKHAGKSFLETAKDVIKAIPKPPVLDRAFGHVNRFLRSML